jgi:hypothetical protein
MVAVEMAALEMVVMGWVVVAVAELGWAAVVA